MSSEELHKDNHSARSVIMGNGQGKKSDLSDDNLSLEMDGNGVREDGDGAVSCDDDLSDGESDIISPSVDEVGKVGCEPN